MSDASYCELVRVNEADERPLPNCPVAEVPTTWDPLLCSLHFSAPIFYADQAEGDASIDIIRTGASDSRVAAKYSTRDISAKAGEIYKAVSGELAFEPGETLKTIVVPLVHSSIWSATVEFSVVLSEPSSCNLDYYLCQCRVKVIDDNACPSNKFRRELMSGVPVRGTDLFWEYAKWNLRSAKLILPSLAVIALDMLGNLSYLLLIWCDMYLVNVVLNPEAPDERLLLSDHWQTAYLIAAAHLVPPLVFHLEGLVKTRLDVEGSSALHLQRNIYRKFMNLSPSHSGSSGELDLMISKDCPAVAHGFAAALDVIEAVGGVGMHVYFILAKNPAAIRFGLSLPAAIAAWVSFRVLCFEPVRTGKQDAALIDFVNDTHGCSELVRTYFLRPQRNAEFVELAAALEAQAGRKARQKLTTDAGLRWIEPVFIGIYIATRVERVLGKDLPIGTFLATIAVMKNISRQAISLHRQVIDLIDTFPPLRKLVNFLNSETELPACKAASRHRGSSTLRAGSSALVCLDAAVSYDDGAEVLVRLNVAAAQGKIVEVRGDHQSGKLTLMRLVGHQINETSGQAFMPTHFRTLFVPGEARFFDQSLTRNLAVGCPGFGGKDVPRLKGILRDLGLKKALSTVDDELASDAKMSGKDGWSKPFTHTELQMLSLARALFANPEVLVLASPFAGLGQSKAKDVAAALVAHVENRGLHMLAKDAAPREPRTLFYSCVDPCPFACADVIWVMTETGELNSRGDPIWTVRLDSNGPA